MRRRGVLARHRWLIMRRLVQCGLLALFMAGPWLGIWWLKGNLASSVILDTVALSDPLIVLQSLAAGQGRGLAAIGGSLTVLAIYLVIGGRSYCAWVCPINPLTDVAAGLRSRLGLGPGWQPSRRMRLWILAALLPFSAVTGLIVWELVNPITILQRGLVFGMGLGWTVVLAVFLFDLLVSRRGWCSHLCPVGAFYGLVGKAAVLRVNAAGRAACTDCGACFRVCPEPQVIAPALKPADAAATPVILSGDCINCGRCIDVCDDKVFEFGLRRVTQRKPAGEIVGGSPKGSAR